MTDPRVTFRVPPDGEWHAVMLDGVKIADVKAPTPNPNGGTWKNARRRYGPRALYWTAKIYLRWTLPARIACRLGRHEWSEVYDERDGELVVLGTECIRCRKWNPS